MSFTCEYGDGTIAEITWTRDILCEAFYDFCNTMPYLYHLTLETKDAAKFIAGRNWDDIRNLKPGDVVYLHRHSFLWRPLVRVPWFT